MASIPELGRSPGTGSGNPRQYSCLENSMDRGTWWGTVHGIAESNMSEHAQTHYAWWSHLELLHLHLQRPFFPNKDTLMGFGCTHLFVWAYNQPIPCGELRWFPTVCWDKARYGLSSGMNRHLTLLSMQHFPLSHNGPPCLKAMAHAWLCLCKELLQLWLLRRGADEDCLTYACRGWLWGWKLGFKNCSCPPELILGLWASNLIKYKNSLREFIKNRNFPSSTYISLLRAAVTKCYRLGTLNNRNLFSHNSGSWKSKVQI